MKLAEINACSGCGACYAICPKNAIEMREAEDGFKYPMVDASLCVNCGRCEKICRQQTQEAGCVPMQAYAARGRAEKMVSRSASGGVFAALAGAAMKRTGAVAGVIMERKNEAFSVRHMLSKDRESLPAMQGSKYIQSDAWVCYAEVIEAIQRGDQVLFSGTPCQVSAIKRLTGDPENLVTVDLICHGVPSARMFNEYAVILGRYFGGKLSNLRFRDKSCGKDFCAEVGIERFGRKRSYYLSSNLLSFYRMFLSGMTYRESCYECPYANCQRISDITIGDYWGIEEKHAEDLKKSGMSGAKDWSCVLVNTDKGMQFLQDCVGELTLIPSSVEWVAEKNQQLNAPSIKPKQRENLMQSYRDMGYAAIEREFVQTHGGKIRYCWRIIKNIRKNRKRRRGNKGKRE